MRDVLFRCSSLGHLMTEPKTRAEGDLSAGARTYLRTLAKQEIFSVDFEVRGREIEKGLRMEADGIALLNQVRGFNLAKNTERRTLGLLTGECDLFNRPARRGHDIKASWSIRTFPGWQADCINPLYEWQMRGYMRLWDADSWEVNYVLLNTPEDLARDESMELHVVDHIPPHLRVTTWALERDLQKEALIQLRLEAAREHYDELVREFADQHRNVIDVQARMATPPAPPRRNAVHLPNLF